MGHRIDRLRVIPKRIVSADPGREGLLAQLGGVRRQAAGQDRCGRDRDRRPPADPGGEAQPVGGGGEEPAGEGRRLPGARCAVRRRAERGRSEAVCRPDRARVERPRSARSWSSACATTEGIDGASAPPAWEQGDTGIVEAIPSTDGAAKPARNVISNLQHNVLPDLQERIGGPVRLTLGGVAPEDRDFVHAVYGNFPYVLGFVVLLTFLLLMRAFRSIVLAAEGGDPQPDLARLRARRRRLHLPAGPRQRGDLGDQGDPGGDRVDPADDLRVPVRSLDGLRGLHRHAHPRGIRRDEGHQAGDRPRPRADGEAGDERGARPGVRVLLAVDRARAGHQTVRDRPGGRRADRRDADPRPARCRR